MFYNTILRLALRLRLTRPETNSGMLYELLIVCKKVTNFRKRIRLLICERLTLTIVPLLPNLGNIHLRIPLSGLKSLKEEFYDV